MQLQCFMFTLFCATCESNILLADATPATLCVLRVKPPFPEKDCHHRGY